MLEMIVDPYIPSHKRQQSIRLLQDKGHYEKRKFRDILLYFFQIV